jgi:hypothetical protein
MHFSCRYFYIIDIGPIIDIWQTLKFVNLRYDWLTDWLTETNLTPWSRVTPKKPTGSQIVKKLPPFYGNRRFITAFTKARHLSLPWARSTQSMIPSHFPKIQFNIILPFIPESFKSSPSLRFPHQDPVCTSPLPYTCYIHCPSQSFRFHLPNRRYKKIIGSFISMQVQRAQTGTMS